MTITASTLTRAAGASAVLSGLLYVLIQPIHPPDELASVTTTWWGIVAALTMGMALLGLVGVTGIYLRQAKQVGVLGLVGYLMFSVFYVLTTAFTFVEILILPLLATEAPQFVVGFTGIFGDSVGGSSMGALNAVGSVGGLLYIVGGVLFGVAIFRARILSRGAALLLSVGAAVTPLVTLLPHAVERIAAVPVGVALVWLGYSLWSEQRKAPADPSLSTQASQLHSTSAA